MKEYIILEIKDVIPRAEELKFKEPINWKIRSNQHWAVIGSNGAGKSLLIDFILQRHALTHDSKIICRDELNNELSVRKTIKCIAFRDIYNYIDSQNSYYQQRWNKGLSSNSPKVSTLLTNNGNEKLLASLVDTFKINDLLEKQIDLLSSGELRKILIIGSLLDNPKILILDNPFIGLDIASKKKFNNLLSDLARYNKVQIILVVPEVSEIPEFITHILPVKDKTVLNPSKRADFLEDEKFKDCLFSKLNKERNTQYLKSLYNQDETSSYRSVALLKKIHVKYDNRTILKNLDWEIKKGEKWALLGANGAGKSTLLSLIYGDNPQAYANDISLFDRKRGSGESIWDIKRLIGYLSPEMHLYYQKNIKCIDVITSGFFDTIGLYKKCNDEQEQIALEWMKVLGIEPLKEVSFVKTSTGEQRLILLARVLVKNPDLYILDEPMHGLDMANKGMVKELINEFCGKEKTLIYVTHNKDEIPENVTLELKLEKNN